jgi:hypothetical protein
MNLSEIKNYKTKFYTNLFGLLKTDLFSAILALLTIDCLLNPLPFR